jgi:hypothetical protein
MEVASVQERSSRSQVGPKGPDRIKRGILPSVNGTTVPSAFSTATGVPGIVVEVKVSKLTHNTGVGG